MQVFFALTITSIGIFLSNNIGLDTGKAKNASGSIFAIVDRQSKIDPCNESGMTLENLKGEIELHHVSFKYPCRPDIQIFRDLSLTIHPGKVKFHHKFPATSTRYNHKICSCLPLYKNYISMQSIFLFFRQLLWLEKVGVGNPL